MSFDFAARCHRVGIDEDNILWFFVGCNTAAGEVDNILFGDIRALFTNDEGTDHLAVLLVRQADHLHVENAVHGVEEFLYLTRVDVLTSTKVSE